VVTATIVLRSELRLTFRVTYRQRVPGERFKRPPIIVLSKIGLGPNRSSFATAPRNFFSGLPARLPTLEPGRDWRGPGGAELGRIEISKAGIFSRVRGRTSSRLIGIPSDIKCCLLVRDRIQFTGCIGGVDAGIYAWNTSLLENKHHYFSSCLGRRWSRNPPCWGDQYLIWPFPFPYWLIRDNVPVDWSNNWSEQFVDQSS